MPDPRTHIFTYPALALPDTLGLVQAVAAQPTLAPYELLSDIVFHEEGKGKTMLCKNRPGTDQQMTLGDYQGNFSQIAEQYMTGPRELERIVLELRLPDSLRTEFAGAVGRNPQDLPVNFYLNADRLQGKYRCVANMSRLEAPRLSADRFGQFSVSRLRQAYADWHKDVRAAVETLSAEPASK